jgi:hypothetical protein
MVLRACDAWSSTTLLLYRGRSFVVRLYVYVAFLFILCCTPMPIAFFFRCARLSRAVRNRFDAQRHRHWSR